MRTLESVAAPSALAALVAAAGVCGLAALSVAYRRTLVRLLRDRHPALWEELARPRPLAPPWERGARRLSAFLRGGRHYVVNDADVAAAGRLSVVTARAAIAVAASGALAAWLLRR